MRSASAYRALIERLEIQSRQQPTGYKLRLVALALVGYAVLGLSVAFALAISVGLLAVLVLTKNWVLLAKLGKFVLLPLGLAWVILRALWVRIEPPHGYVVRPGEAPELEAEVERLRQLTGAPQLSGIIIDEELNAAAASVPRALGLLGSRHYLVLGLPLMQLLDEDELRAVIAHEFGHFGRGHGRFAGWIYRLRQSWFRVLAALEAQQAMASGLYARFFNWYAPYFNAYSFVLARSNEYEADAVAREVAGVEAAGSALVRIELGAHRLHADFWPGVDRSTAQVAAPPVALYRQMGEALALQAPDDATRLQQALARQPGLDDTHPVLAQRLSVLAQRLSALGAGATLAPRGSRSALQALLGELGPALESRFSHDWCEWIQERWQQRHQASAEQRRRMAALQQALDEGGLGAEEMTEYAVLADDRDPDGSAEPLLRRALIGQPGHLALNFRLGAILLQRGDADGVAHLRRCVVEHDPATAEAALRQIAAFHEREGEVQAFDATVDELQALYADQQRVDLERREWRARDPLLAHGLPPEALDALLASLRATGKVSRAWLARKPIAGEAGVPHHVMVVKLRLSFRSEQRMLDDVMQHISLPGSWVVLTRNSVKRAQWRRIKKVPGARLDP